jgi:hypothetical protein
MRFIMRRFAPLAVFLLASCAWFFAPTSLDGLAEAQIRASCHFAFACCSAPEREAFDQNDFKDEGTCVDESLQSQNTENTTLARAKAVVAAGKGTFDDKRAAECEQPVIDAENKCDAATVLGGKPIADGLCSFDADRGYVKGTVADGQKCNDDIECADYGTCDRSGTDPNTVTTAGKCKAAKANGDVCIDPNTQEQFDCQPGLSCATDPQTGKSTCQPIALEAAGQPCFSGAECKDGFCIKKQVLQCEFSGNPCTKDADCTDFPGEKCQPQDSSVCSKTGPTVDVCKGGQ